MQVREWLLEEQNKTVVPEASSHVLSSAADAEVVRAGRENFQRQVKAPRALRVALLTASCMSPLDGARWPGLWPLNSAVVGCPNAQTARLREEARALRMGDGSAGSRTVIFFVSLMPRAEFLSEELMTTTLRDGEGYGQVRVGASVEGRVGVRVKVRVQGRVGVSVSLRIS